MPNTPPANFLFHDIPPGGLHAFLALAMPVAACLPSLALSLLLYLWPSGIPRTPRGVLWIDRIASLALLLLIPLVGAWHSLPHPFVLCGALLLGTVALKGAALVKFFTRHFRSADSGNALGWRRAWLVWLAAFCLMAPLSIWVLNSYSAAGDEVRYLLISHSLARHGTTDVSRTVAAQEYRAFYTGSWHPAMSWSVERAGTHVFHLMLAPAYMIGGRTAVMLFMAAIAALAAAGLLSWLWRSGLSPPAAGAAVLLTCACAPILNLSQHALPDVPGLLLFTAGLLLLQRFRDAPLRAWAGLLLVAVLLLLLKNRLGFLGLGLLMAGAMEQWAWLRKAHRGASWLWAGLTLLLGGALVWGLDRSGLLLWDVGLWAQRYLERWAEADGWWRPITVFLGGMGLDQEHGILLPAPIFILALAGLPAACRRLPGPARQALIPALFYIAVVGFLRWDRFFGGNGPAGRFIAVILPAAALFIAYAWQHLQRRPWRLAPWILAGLTLSWSLVLTLIPSAQFHSTTGMNKIVGMLGRWWGHDLHHLVPSSFSAAALWWPWLIGGAALTGVLAWRVWADAKRPALEHPPRRAWEWGLAAAIFIVCVTVFLGLAKAMPSNILEAEQMVGEGSSLYGVLAGGAKPVGRSLVSGGKARGRLYHPGGDRELVVTGHSGRPGRVNLSVSGRLIGSKSYSGKDQLRFPLGPRKEGYMQIELTWHSCATKECYLFIDRLELIDGRRPITGKP